MSFLLTAKGGLSKFLSMRTRPKQPSRPNPVVLVLATTLALGGVAGACKDPNPTFVFDASSDGAKDAVTDGAGSVDTSGAGGGGAGAGGAGGGAAGAGGGGSGGAAAGAGGQAGATSGSGGAGGTTGAAGAGGAS